MTSSTTDAVLEAPPTVTAANINGSPNEAFAASSLFNATDSDGTPILAYQVIDTSTGATSGFWLLGTVVLPANQAVTISAAQLSQLTFVAGSPLSGAAPDLLEVSAADAGGFGAFTSFTVTAAQDAPDSRLPVVTAANQVATVGTTFASANLFSASPPSGGTIVSYELVDTTPNSGSWILDGVVELANQALDVTAEQLSQLSFQTDIGTATIMVRANDGSQWSNYTTFQILAPAQCGASGGRNLRHDPGTGHKRQL